MCRTVKLPDAVSLLVVAMVVAAACGAADTDEAVTTGAASSTTTATTMATSTIPVTTTTATSTIPVTTTTAAPEPAPTTTALAATSSIAVVYGGSGRAGESWVPLGWWDGTAWQQAGFDAAGVFVDPPSAGIDSIAATSLDFADGPSATVTGLTAGPLGPYCVGDESGPEIDLGFEAPKSAVSIAYDVVAVTADWPLQPRPVSQLGLDAAVYAEVGAALMAAEASTAGLGEVVQVVRADLDGNGIEEVLVTYEHITEPNFGAAGDFSSIYVRYPSADGTVTDELLFSYVMDDPVDFPTIGRATIAAVADLNGDGVMEVAVRDMFWESGSMYVSALVDGRLVAVIGNGCGV